MFVSHLAAAALVACSLPSVGADGGRPMNGWARTSVANMPPTHTLAFRLQRAQPDALPRAIDDVSNPTSNRYRQYLSKSEVAALVEPVAGAYSAVAAWAERTVPACVVQPSPHGDYLLVEAHPDALESLFGGHVDFVPFKHAASRHTRVAGSDHVRDAVTLLPSHVQPLVETVFGVNELFPVPTKPVIVHDGAGAGFKGDDITPTVLRSHYNVTASGSGQPGVVQGIAAFEDAQFRQEDVDSFTARYSLKNVNIDVLGPNDGGYYGEAGLDTQYIMSTGEGIKTWFLSQERFDLLAWSFLVTNMTAPPQVLSISWGSGESGYRADHMTAANDEFGKMGLLGMSIFTASGDDGVSRRSFNKCYDPTWPTVAPYITSVGGTYLTKSTETAWVSSGGGFSAVFDRPHYQDAAVTSYLNSAAAIPPAAKFSVGGRATPDVSAVATNYLVDSFSTTGKLTGTSAGTPVVAGMVSLINDMRAAEGKGPVGFINPTLYAAFATMGNNFLGYDIVAGDNKLGKCAGFPAIPGYDAVTGFGSPEFSRLYHVLNN